MRQSILGLSLTLLLCACGKDEPLGVARSRDAGSITYRNAWHSLGYDNANSRHNRAETTLTAANVANLKPKWLLLDVTTGITSTPAVVDGIVYFGEWGRTVRAVRAADGTEFWRTSVDGNPRASPLVVGDRVFVSAGREVYALERSNGEVVWQVPLDDHPQTNLDSSPVWAEGRIIIGVAGFEISLAKDDYTFRGSVVALNAEDGKELWRVYTTENDATSGAGVSVWSSAAVDEVRKHVYIGTGNTYEEPASPYSDAVLAIDYVSGERVWHTQFTEGDVFTIPNPVGPDADIGASPNLFSAGGRDLVGAGSKGGWYKALDRSDGSVVWERRLGPGSALGGIMTTSAVDDDFVYVNSNQGAVSVTTALRLADGVTEWETNLTPAFGALTLAGGVLYQPTLQGTAYALDTRTGNVLWSTDLVSDLGGGISVAGGTVYVPRGFSFLITRYQNAGGLIAFSLDGAASIDFKDGGSSVDSGKPTDAGSDVQGPTREQCLTSTAPEISAGCRDCSCACDPAAIAACDTSCWAVFGCITDNCGTADFSTAAGRECVERECTDVKLLPDSVQAATLLAAPCMVTCRPSCESG